MESIDTFQAGIAERSRLENLLALEELVTQAARQGVLSPLPEDETQVITNAFIKTRLRTVRLWLTWLGYLIEKEAPGGGRLAINATARKAIRQFQAEAGLTVDGWVGPETWQALEALVSFEHPLSAAEWLAKPAAQQQALWRAVRLRLSVLGFPRLPKPCQRREEALPGLRRFAEAARRLALIPAGMTEQDTLEMIDLLFDEDALVKGLSEFNGAFPFDDTGAGKQAQRFVTCVARIELWLLGAKIPLSNHADPARSLKDLHPTAALYNFWRLQDLGIVAARQRARQVLEAAFFKELYAATTGDARAVEDAQLGEWLYKRLSRKDSSLRQPVWETIHELGSRMWDGIRRLWNWVKDRLEKISQGLKSWVLNLARLTHHLAQSAFEKVYRGVVRLGEAVRFGMPGMVPKSEPPSFFIHASRVLDYTVFASQPEDAAKVRALAGEMRQHAQDFGVVVELLSTLLAALAATVIPGGGWLVLLVALARCVKAVLEAARALA